MAEGQGYIGRSPGDSAVIIASQTFEPTGIQTNFTFASGYDPGYIDVYLNGARLIYANDYTATDGSTVALVDSASNGDVLECVAYKAFNVAQVSSSTGNFTVGQDLTVTGFTTGGSAYYSGIVTASSFAGDGSALTGVASTDNIITGVAVTIGGILRVTDTTQSTSSTTGAVIVSGGVGIAKSLHVGGNVTVGGTITYEDVTNQDVIGLATFRSGVQFGAAGVGGTIAANGDTTIAGVITAAQGIRVTGGTVGIKNDTSGFNDGGDDLVIGSGVIHTHTGMTLYSHSNDNGSIWFSDSVTTDVVGLIQYRHAEDALRFSVAGTERLRINASGGLNVTGISTVAGNSFVGSAITMYASSGIVSATSYYGDGSQLEGVSSPTVIDITSCLFI